MSTALMLKASSSRAAALVVALLGPLFPSIWPHPLGAQESVSVSRQVNGETVRIDRPIVNHPTTTYPTVRFRPGDHWTIRADGCVQTGGSGSTWKRYVDPRGDNSDRLYYGVVDVLDGGPMRPIRDVQGKTQIVPSNIDTAHAVLRLGYVDDEYGDNSYEDHDDGTQDQCKGVGPAFVIVQITRETPLATARDPIRRAINPHLTDLQRKAIVAMSQPGVRPGGDITPPAPAPPAATPPAAPPPPAAVPVTFSLRVAPTTILGLGFASARAIVVVNGLAPSESTSVVLQAIHSYVTPEVLWVRSGTPAVATIRSDGLRGDTLVAILGNLPPSPVWLTYVFPTSFLISALIGAGLGTLLAWTQYKGRRTGTAAVKLLLAAMICGMLLAIAVCALGITIAGFVPAATTGQALVLFVAAIGAWGGPKLLSRVIPGLTGEGN